MEMNDNQLEKLNFIHKINNSISSFASLIIIILYINNKRINDFRFEHTLHLSISTLLSGFSAFLDYKVKNDSCLIASFLQIFSNLSTVLWVLFIAKSALYKLTDDFEFEKKLTKIKLKYYIISYGLPLLLCCLVTITDTWGPAGGCCWLNMNEDGDEIKLKDLFVVLFYSIYWIFTLMTFNYILKTIRILNKLTIRGSKEYQDFYKIYSRYLMLYPIIGLLVGIPRTINRLFFMNSTSFPLYLVQTIVDSIQGLLFSFTSLITFSPFLKTMKKCLIYLCLKGKNDNLLNESKFMIRRVESMNKEDTLESVTDESKKTFILVKEEFTNPNM